MCGIISNGWILEYADISSSFKFEVRGSILIGMSETLKRLPD